MKRVLLIVALLCCTGLVGCIYDTPEYVTVGPSTSAFLVPLEGDVKNQKQFSSVETLKNAQVSAKRIQITHRWDQRGYSWGDGGYIPNVMVIVVERAPVTRVWTADPNTGTATGNQAIWAESRDSVGFSTGFTVSAMIKEEDAALFLYRYPSGILAKILDEEVRGRIQAAFSDFSAGYDMSDLREKKAEIASAIRADVVPFFLQRGITVTTIGLTGGFTYENPKIQESIDKVFIAQREKEVQAALLSAQRDKNAIINQEAEALAKKEFQIAEGIANGQKKILEVAKAASQDPVFIEMKKLEVELERIKKWNGGYPTFMLSFGQAAAAKIAEIMPK